MNDELCERAARSHDRADAAQCGEPDPWDPEYVTETFRQERIAAMRVALEAIAPMLAPQWRPISTIPTDGRRVLVFRPLAERTNDQPIAIKRTRGWNEWCWPETVPSGAKSTNPTDGACHATHWMPLPAAPDAEESR